MNAQSTLQMVNAFANQYDCYIKDCHWTGPELFYSWLKPFLKKGQKLLDIGIGTGLSSILYQPDGIEIYGIDGSEEMIRLTAEKQFTRELKQIDLCSDELWFDGIHFDYAIAHAVFHLVGDIEPIVKNCSESFMDAGYFIFTFEEMTEIQDDFQPSSYPGIFERTNQPSQLRVYRHSKSYVENLLATYSFEIIRCEKFLAFIEPQTHTETNYQAVMARKI